MRYLLTFSLLCTAVLATGCSVQVKEQPAPAPVVKRDRKVDINVDAPGVDVKVKRDK